MWHTADTEQRPSVLLGGAWLPSLVPAEAQHFCLVQKQACVPLFRSHIQKAASLGASSSNLTADHDVIINAQYLLMICCYSETTWSTQTLNLAHIAFNRTCDRIKHVLDFFKLKWCYFWSGTDGDFLPFAFVLKFNNIRTTLYLWSFFVTEQARNVYASI